MQISQVERRACFFFFYECVCVLTFLFFWWGSNYGSAKEERLEVLRICRSTVTGNERKRVSLLRQRHRLPSDAMSSNSGRQDCTTPPHRLRFNNIHASLKAAIAMSTTRAACPWTRHGKQRRARKFNERIHANTQKI
jgi:hypothetical protein